MVKAEHGFLGKVENRRAPGGSVLRALPEIADVVQRHVDAEYDRWHTRAINAPSAVEQHFIEATAKVKKLAADKPAKGKKSAEAEQSG